MSRGICHVPEKQVATGSSEAIAQGIGNWEAPGSFEAVARHFARRYLSAVLANLFEYQVLDP